MRRVSALVIFASLAWFAPAIHAESHNPTDYPLRIHIYRRNETTFYQNRQAEEAKGEGRANLFEGGAAQRHRFPVRVRHKATDFLRLRDFSGQVEEAGAGARCPAAAVWKNQLRTPAG